MDEIYGVVRVNRRATYDHEKIYAISITRA
jgi:hypothetical protein